MRALLAGGGTAGHTSPLLATAAVLSEAGVDITCLGTPRGLEVTLIPQAGYPLELVPPVPLPRRPGKAMVQVPGRLRAAVKATGEVIDRVRPDVIVGFGGYVSVPAYLIARRRHIPLVVHEGNAIPGIANKLGARFTEHVATSFPDTDLPHAHYIGLPIRREISGLDRAAVRAEARAHFGLDPDRPTLLVTGGSQGARRINQTIVVGSARPGRRRRAGAARRGTTRRGGRSTRVRATRRTSCCRSSTAWTSRMPRRTSSCAGPVPTP